MKKSIKILAETLSSKTISSKNTIKKETQFLASPIISI